MFVLPGLRVVGDREEGRFQGGIAALPVNVQQRVTHGAEMPALAQMQDQQVTAQIFNQAQQM